MKVTQGAAPMITLGSERDPAATVGLIEMPVFHKMQRQMLRALEMLLEAGATIALNQPDRFGYLSITIHEIGMSGYEIETRCVVNGVAATTAFYRDTTQAAMRAALSFAHGSCPFDWAEFVEPGE